MPVGALQEIDEVDANGLIGLLHLPVLGANAFEVLTELQDSVGQRGVGRRPHQELAHVAHEEWRRPLFDESGLEKEFTELLQGGFEFAHVRLHTTMQISDRDEECCSSVCSRTSCPLDAQRLYGWLIRRRPEAETLVSCARHFSTSSGRGIPPRGVAHRSLMPNKLALRALRSGRRAPEAVY